MPVHPCCYRPSRLWLSGVLMALGLNAGLAGAEEFSFDASEFEKKPFEFSGYIEPKLEGLRLRSDNPAYDLSYPDAAPRDSLWRGTITLELAGKVNLADWVLDARTQGSQANDALVSRTQEPRVMEGGARYSARPGLTLDAGKRVQRWGKGYALTTVGFVEIPKDPSDPAASREGLVMASGEFTRSLQGPVSAVSFTGLLVPTDGTMNDVFGKSHDLNPAARLYLLAWDTDIDLMWRAAGARPAALGLDFSRNIGSNLEVHGEWSRQRNVTRHTVSATGVVSSTTRDATSGLLGVRYLTSDEVTWIADWIHNGLGYSDGELGDYYRFLNLALAPGAPAGLAAKAASLARSGFLRANPGQDYVYLKASVNEPLGWVYAAASLTWMTNAQDRSWQLTPELSYTGFNGWDLRGRLFWLQGSDLSEFGAKVTARKLELTARFSF